MTPALQSACAAMADPTLSRQPGLAAACADVAALPNKHILRLADRYDPNEINRECPALIGLTRACDRYWTLRHYCWMERREARRRPDSSALWLPIKQWRMRAAAIAERRRMQAEQRQRELFAPAAE